MHPYDPLRFHGTVVWLTEAQGGRRAEPPEPPPGRDYAANAFVPPLTVDTGLTSFVIRPATLGAWRCAADAGWLVGISGSGGNTLGLQFPDGSGSKVHIK
jgi:hypothetical protein